MATTTQRLTVLTSAVADGSGLNSVGHEVGQGILAAWQWVVGSWNWVLTNFARDWDSFLPDLIVALTTGVIIAIAVFRAERRASKREVEAERSRRQAALIHGLATASIDYPFTYPRDHLLPKDPSLARLLKAISPIERPSDYRRKHPDGYEWLLRLDDSFSNMRMRVEDIDRILLSSIGYRPATRPDLIHAISAYSRYPKVGPGPHAPEWLPESLIADWATRDAGERQSIRGVMERPELIKAVNEYAEARNEVEGYRAAAKAERDYYTRVSDRVNQLWKEEWDTGILDRLRNHYKVHRLQRDVPEFARLAASNAFYAAGGGWDQYVHETRSEQRYLVPEPWEDRRMAPKH